MRWYEKLSNGQVRQWLGRHLLFWFVYVVFFTWVMMPRVGGFTVSLQTALLHLPFHFLFVYSMLYGIIPRLVQGKYTQFAVLVGFFLLGSLVGHFLFRALVLIPFRTGKPTPVFNGVLNTSYLTIFTVGGFMIMHCLVLTALGIKLARYWYEKERHTQQLNHETLTVELQVLKAQIHPHFLFNTLNNLYSLTLQQSRQAPDTVRKLADLLHYMLHECNRPTVLLSQEIDFLNSYIALEKLRYGNRLINTTTVQGNTNDQSITPLLLIPFLENAFKHGASQQTDQARIDLLVRMENRVLTFRLENSIDRTSKTQSALLFRSAPATTRGIGLANVRKRLQLLYPAAHHLAIQEKPGCFVVELNIILPIHSVAGEEVSRSARTA
ncbi:hypothetical protein GCM10027299_49550 [Larkinella ripae]